jgi:hypothetical protein
MQTCGAHCRSLWSLGLKWCHSKSTNLKSNWSGAFECSVATFSMNEVLYFFNSLCYIPLASHTSISLHYLQVWDFTTYFILSHILIAVDSQTWNPVSWKMVVLDMSRFQYSGNELYALGLLNLQYKTAWVKKIQAIEMVWWREKNRMIIFEYCIYNWVCNSLQLCHCFGHLQIGCGLKSGMNVRGPEKLLSPR